MLTILTITTICVVALVVVVLAFYLTLVLYHLRRAGTGSGSHLARLAGGLEAVATNTDPLPDRLSTIRGALIELKGGLGAVDGHLSAIRGVLYGRGR